MCDPMAVSILGIFEEYVVTYLVGASCSSIGPLMKTARLCVAALMSSWALLMFNLAISSSRTLTLFLFSAIFVDDG